MKPKLSVLFAAALALAFPGFATVHDVRAQEMAATSSLADTQAALRDLWLGHIFWVRNVVDARIDGDKNAASAAEQQVVANAQAIAGAFGPFYGEAASQKLFELLAGHWGAISGYLDATIASNKADQDRNLQQLVENANAIASFLGGANPNWPVDTVGGLLAAHGGHHVEQIRQFEAGEFEGEAKTWAMMKDHMYVIADALAGGLALQFPDRFK